MAESAPNDLLTKFQCETIEGAFLILCTRQEEGQISEIVQEDLQDHEPDIELTVFEKVDKKVC